MQVAGGLALSAVLLALGRWPAFDAPTALASAALGVLSVAAMMLLYRALALGPISVVSPITASYLALTVILVVVFLGERLSGAQAAMVAVVFVGVALTSTDLGTLAGTLGRRLPGVGFALGATLCFGLWGALFAAITRAADPLAVVLAGRAAGFVATLVLLRWMPMTSLPLGLGVRMLSLIGVIGVTDAAANVAFALGVDSGNASITAAGTGAYPVVPAILAIVVLGERLARNQYAGLLILILGLVGLGLAA